MALSAVIAVALAVAVVAAVAAALAAVSARRRAAAALAPVVGGAGSLDELLSRVATAFEALSERATRAEGVVDRLTDALSAVPEGVVLCDEHRQVWFRNEVAQMFAGARHGEALADLAVTELLDAALRTGTDAQYPSQYLELYGPPRRTLLIRAIPLREGGALLGAVAVIEDVSERRRLEAVRRDFVANVSHELKSPVGALGILAEAMQLEDEPAVSRRLAERMQTTFLQVYQRSQRNGETMRHSCLITSKSDR